MTRRLPNEPLWPRADRSGISPAAMSSSSLTAPAGNGSLRPTLSLPVATASRRPKRTGPRSGTGRPRRTRLGSVLSVRGVRCERGRPAGLGRLPEPLDAGQDPPLALIEPVLDIGREEVAPAGGADPEGDRDRVVRFVRDRDRDPVHAELTGTGLGTPMEPDRRLAGRQPLDLDVTPADPPDPD